MNGDEELEAGAHMALSWYRRGRIDFSLGRRYDPPDNALLRNVYAEGWADEIQGRYPTDEEVLGGIFDL